MKEKAGYDLDGVICQLKSEGQKPNWLYWLSLLFIKPMPGARQALMSLPSEIVVVTAQPRWAFIATWIWFKFHKIPYQELFLVGSWRDKLPALRKAGVSIYFDDKQKVVDFLRQNGINAQLFISWQDTLKHWEK